MAPINWSSFTRGTYASDAKERATLKMGVILAPNLGGRIDQCLRRIRKQRSNQPTAGRL